MLRTLDYNITIITDAIRMRRRIWIDYTAGQRLCEPHTLGYKSDGTVLLRSYQVHGPSESGHNEGWKLFTVAKARNVELSEETFPGPRNGYVRGDSVMKGGIIEEL